MTIRKPELSRFFEKVQKTKSCWLWTASKTSFGYGQFYYSGRPRRAHRWIYEKTFGTIPSGRLILHSCDVKHCVNPSHLSIGDHSQNGLEAVERGLTQFDPKFCPSGHLFDEKNTAYRVSKTGRRQRKCRTCHRIREKNRKGLSYEG